MKCQDDCPRCGASKTTRPDGDILRLSCVACGLTIGADDIHSASDNWRRRARDETEYPTGQTVRYRAGMSDEDLTRLSGEGPWDPKRGSAT